MTSHEKSWGCNISFLKLSKNRVKSTIFGVVGRESANEMEESGMENALLLAKSYQSHINIFKAELTFYNSNDTLIKIDKVIGGQYTVV